MFLRTFQSIAAFERVLDRERAAFDKQIALERRQSDDALKSLDKFSVTC